MQLLNNKHKKYLHE